MRWRIELLKESVHKLQMTSDPRVVFWTTMTYGRIVYWLDRLVP